MHILMNKTAQLVNQLTGKVHNNAHNHGNVEEAEHAKEVDGAPVKTTVPMKS